MHTDFCSKENIEEREIIRAIGLLFDAIAKADSLFENLADRLEPVLSPELPEETDGVDESAPETKIGQEINRAVNSIKSLQTRIYRVDERLGI
jgi:hypothetical protein